MTLHGLDRLTAFFAPRWTLARARARLALRHYEAAQGGRRTQGWARDRGDANTVSARALVELRLHARDLVRNNGWARRAQRVLADHAAGWGIVPHPQGPAADRAAELWKRWADSTQCDADSRTTFAGLQHLVMRSLATDGEVLVRRRPRRAEDGLSLPLQLQVLEADYLDTSKDGVAGPSGGPIIQGVEFDQVGRRTAYWLFPQHPGSSAPLARGGAGVSRPVPASEVLHVYYLDRPGQVRGLSWYGAAIVPLKELDAYEDAELVAAKIAACFAAFVTDADGAGAPLGVQDAQDPMVERFEPGMISRLPPGRDVKFGTPPAAAPSEFSSRQLRKIAAALGCTYEDLTGDYRSATYSSARMARLAHWASVYDYQHNMLIPQLCAGVWGWAMGAAEIAGLVDSVPDAEWTTPAVPMLEPDREGLAYQRLVRAGVLTPSDVVREQGRDPRRHWQAYADDLTELDRQGIVLDCDPRRTSQAGNAQAQAGLTRADSGGTGEGDGQ